jgi:hypothetical protein
MSLNGGKAMHLVQQLLSEIGDGMWQDVMLSAGNIVFCVTLIPMLRQPERPPLLTCIPTGLALLAGGFVFASLHLWLTALTQTITGLQWLALVFKRPPTATSSLPASLKQLFEPAASVWRFFDSAALYVRRAWNSTTSAHRIPGRSAARWS